MNYPKPQILQVPTEGNKPRYIYVPEYKAKSFVQPSAFNDDFFYPKRSEERWKPSNIFTTILLFGVLLFIAPLIIKILKRR